MTLFAPLYLILLIFVLVASAFVVFHLLRYSMDKLVAMATIIVFILVTGLLLLANLYFFTQIPFASLLDSSPFN